MISLDAATLGIVGVIVGALLTHRGARRVAGEDRLWARRADLYLELLDWLDEDLRRQELYQAPSEEHRSALRNRLRAFGTDRVDRALQEYLQARRANWQSAPDERVQLRANWLRLAVRNDLAALPRRSEDVALAVLGSRPVYKPVARLSKWLRRRDESRYPIERR
jgi:hypothetical protein